MLLVVWMLTVVVQMSVVMTLESILRLLLPKGDAEAVVGDLEERRLKIERLRGTTSAAFWFYSQVFRAIAPFVWAAFKRVSGIDAALRRFGG